MDDECFNSTNNRPAFLPVGYLLFLPGSFYPLFSTGSLFAGDQHSSGSIIIINIEFKRSTQIYKFKEVVAANIECGQVGGIPVYVETLAAGYSTGRLIITNGKFTANSLISFACCTGN